MEPDIAQHVIHKGPSAAISSTKRQLTEFLSEKTAPLLGTLRVYVQRMGLANGEEVPAVALEILQEVAIEALDHADRFNPTGQPMAWLLGIATNVIKRKKVERAKRSMRELSITRFSTTEQEAMSESELFDQITTPILTGPEQEIEASEQASTMLALVSAEDQHILRLAFVYDFEREALAEELGITPGAARVRLHRALSRLRVAWQKQQIQQQRGEHHA